MPRLRLALAQTNPVVGDLAGNADQIIDFTRRAADAGADLVAFGEMALSGYPVEDLATRPGFLRECAAAVERLARRLEAEGLGGLPVVVGHPDGPHPPRLLGTSNAPSAIAQNVASVLQHGEVVARVAKHHLPNYSVFDEYRVFIPGDTLLVLGLKGADIALIVCEDLWRDGGPVARVLDAGAGLLLVINASPFERDKDEVRLPLVTRRAVETSSVVAYVNLVGGQDDLVFDGDSVIVDTDGSVLARAPQFEPYLLLSDLDIGAATPAAMPSEVADHGATSFVDGGAAEPELKHIERVPLTALQHGDDARSPDIAVPPEPHEVLWNALVLGLRDYVEKNGFSSVVLGLSGGIDSAVTAAIAADAIGADRVYGVSMPSRYSSEHSRSDADLSAQAIGLHYSTEPIHDLVVPFEQQLGLDGIAAENLQARARAVILMGLSNQHGHLVLTTGNKTEISVGYSTIYGDSVGGFAPIKDVPKTLVWDLARWRNAAALSRGQTPPIPQNSIDKPPSAELRPGQTDQDTLPDYPLLDAILEAYVTRRETREELVEHGFDAAVVDNVIRLVDRAEWKRRQSAIGPKISGMAFGRDRRLPITYRPTH